MVRRALRALVLMGAVVALGGCLPSAPFRFPILYNGSMDVGTLRADLVPEACPDRQLTLAGPVTIGLEDQATGDFLGLFSGRLTITHCWPLEDAGDIGEMTVECCHSERGVPPVQFSGPARVVGDERQLSVDATIEEGTGRYQEATGDCHFDVRPLRVPEPPGTLPIVGASFSCRIGGPDGPPPPSFRLLTALLPDGALGEPYEASLTATGGTPPYTWSAIGLPPGLRVEGQAIVGEPTTTGSTEVQVTVEDSAGLTRTVTLSIRTHDPDVFGTIRPVSDDPSELWRGWNADVSDDGRMVAFDSEYEPGEGNGSPPDGYAWDRATNSVRRLTVDGPGTSSLVRVSGDGGTVVFGTEQAVVPEDTDGAYDVYLADAATGSTTWVSSGPGTFLGADVSDDGQRVVYVRTDEEPARLLAWDRPTGTTTEVAELGGSGWDHQLSDDGSWLTFVSDDADIVPGDPDGLADVFLVDLGTGAVTLLETGDGRVLGADLSGDGRTVAFMSETNDFLPPGEADANGRGDLFTLDVLTGEVVRLTNGNAPSGTLSGTPSISDDGRAITFASVATDIASGEQDTGEGSDLFYWNADTGLISRLTRGPAPADFGTNRSAISGDGRTVVFTSTDHDLSPARPHPDGAYMFVYVWDRTT